jgi:hypothetical protein
MQTGPLAGYMPDFSEYVLGPVPVLRPVPPDVSVQALGTFSLRITNLALHEEPVRVELGIPPSALLYQATLIEPLGWQGTRLEIVGTVAEHPVLPGVPQFTNLFDQENPLTIIAWRRRLYFEGHSGVSVEVRWRPATPETNVLTWPPHIPRTTATRYIDMGLRLLRGDKRRGRRWRPPSAREREAFCTTIVGLIRLSVRQKIEPSQAFIAELYREGCSKGPLHTPSVAEMNRSAESAARTLRNHLVHYGYTWEEMLTLAHRAP